ncbi:ABC-type glycerol-3-phosphate transport system substrate-binding protein [Povalibacter uvarum]|uniref:ABC-type glycerol-3-phosphate transport system substrate-binding protein n=1 Tax=Povalibacter uvarum TaxID=732238 RepID=A0A841HRD1_9GAMM|nr:hypothetical protein [Povalibacter uvarum]MBB6095323.1 ABC-type glycerol-3-phosphate transport system substrate-binding protein [Povalibacter uvarum]
MKPLQHAVAIATAALAVVLTGCGGGSGSGGSGDEPVSPAPPAPPPVSQTNFTVFTRDQVTVTAMTESADPVEIEKIDWVFPDGESETVYDDLLATSP